MKTKAVCLGLAAIFAAVVVLLALRSPRPQPVSIGFVGTTNGTVGLTNTHWFVYVVTNHTTNSFTFAGAKILLKTGHGWILDPTLRATETGSWIVPPTRMWRDESGIRRFGETLPARGSFRLFLAAPADATRWKTSLR